MIMKKTKINYVDGDATNPTGDSKKNYLKY